LSLSYRMRRDQLPLRPLQRIVRSISASASTDGLGKWVPDERFMADLNSLGAGWVRRLSRIIDANRLTVPVYEALGVVDSPPIRGLRGHLGPMVQRIAERRRCRDELLRRLVEVLDSEGVDYAVFKTLNRLRWVGVDVDVIIDPSSFDTCVEALLAEGFYSIDDLSKRYATGFMVRGNPIIVDLHTVLAVLGVGYMSSDLLMGGRRRIVFKPSDGSDEFPLSLVDETVDALARMAHSVLKEGTVMIGDVAEVSPAVEGDLDLIKGYIDDENLGLAASIFSYIALHMTRDERFRCLIVFDGGFTHGLAKGILANSVQGSTLPPYHIPVAACVLAFLDALNGRGEICGHMPLLMHSLRYRRNAAHLGRKVLERLS